MGGKNMGEDVTNIRLDTIEKHQEARDKKQEEMNKEMQEIKIINVRQETTLSIIMVILKLMLATFITFVITNVGMFYISKFSNK
jgi:hypothetical protein